MKMITTGMATLEKRKEMKPILSLTLVQVELQMKLKTRPQLKTRL